jgi:iron(III) transport system permease protein
LPALLVGAAMLLPLVYLAIRSAGASDDAWRLLFRARTALTLGRTLLLIGTVTGSSILVAVPLAWLTVRTDIPLRKTLSVMAALPLVIPSFVGAFLLVSAFGPKGLAQQLLAPLGVERLPDIYGLPGATLALALLSYPYIYLTVRGALLNLDPALEESARSLGHNAWSSFVRVVVPQLRPSVVAGSLLVALYTMSDFGAVSLMRFPTFTWVIYQQYETSFDRSIAAVLSLVLVGMAVAILLTEHLSRGRQKYYRVGSGASREQRPMRLGRWKWVAFGFAGAVVGLALALPMSLLAYWLARGIGAGEPLLLLWDATRNSLYVSLVAALVTVVMSLPVAVLLVRYPSIVSKAIEPATYTGYALPGVVVALALVFFGVNFARPVYQTIWLLVFAYAVLFFPVALGSVRSSLLQISPRVEDAARGLGHNPVRVLLKITIPMMKSGVLMGAALVFLLTMKELPATLILGPLGFKTLASSVWSASSEAFFARAAAPALMLVLMSSVPMAILVLREKHRKL